MIQPDALAFALRHLQAGERVMLLLVAESSGASPGRPGFKLAVSSGGGLCGTIGGGAVEHGCVEEARDSHSGPPAPPYVRRYTHGAEPGIPTGMICGGTQTVLFWTLSREDTPLLVALLEADPSTALLVTAKGAALAPATGDSGVQFRRSASGWTYAEPAGSTDAVYIVGGGHCAQALCRVLAILSWRAVVIDDRPEAAQAAGEIPGTRVVVAPFAEAGRHIPDGPGTHVIIMTPAHTADESVLRQIVHRPVGYVGMMASPAKAAALLSRLRADGVAAEALSRVHTPVGLPIGSQTAAEIAVSIAAELIHHRRLTEGAVRR